MHPSELISMLKAFLSKNHSVYIQTHNFPDPDAISSAFGLQEFLAYHQIPAILCYDGRIDRLSSRKMLDTFGIAMHSGKSLAQMTADDLIILVDSQKRNSNVTGLAGRVVACIDHHPVFNPCEYRYLDLKTTGACASIVASYFQQTQTPVSVAAASALAYGIKIDTAEFTRGTSQLDVDMFHFLFSHADWRLVQDMYSNAMEYDDLRAYGAAIQSIRIYGGTGFAHIPFPCSQPLIAILSDFILALDVVTVSVVYAADESGIHFSVRSQLPDLHAGELITAALAGIGTGGGHPSMAGGTIPASNLASLGLQLDITIHQRFLLAEQTLLGEPIGE